MKPHDGMKLYFWNGIEDSAHVLKPNCSPRKGSFKDYKKLDFLNSRMKGKGYGLIKCRVGFAILKQRL
ncbi:hypothetical protein QQF64_026638 [Cirrhinus molitorella]|uniref:Uncharacterized protein n=1 Tax=Cirrhinus molitorella TaxID=172907 RepID=A0ABR3NA50_9TELE